MRDFRTLNVWEKAHALALAIYAATEQIPVRDEGEVTGRLRKQGAAIPASIARACGQPSDVDMVGDLHQALSSASELEYTLLLAHEIHLLDTTGYNTLHLQITEIKRMLTGFVRKVRTPM